MTPQTVLGGLLGGSRPAEQERGSGTALPASGALGRRPWRGRWLPEVDAVRCVQDGAPVEVPRGDGQVVHLPLRGEDHRGLLDAPAR